MKIIKYGKAEFASGLFWQAIADPKNLKLEIKSKAEKLKEDFYVIRKSGAIQVGFSGVADGGKAGLYSLALAVAKRVKEMDSPRSWMTAFKMPDGSYCYIASRDDNFLPEGDEIGSLEEIIAKMSSDYSIGDWDKIYASDEFGFAGSVKVDFDFMLPKKGKKLHLESSWKLIPVKSKLPIKPIAFSVALLFAAYFGYSQYTEYKQRIEDEVIQRNIARARLLLNQQKTVEIIKHPWSMLPISPQVINECLSQFKAELFYPAGWSMTEYSCDLDSAKYLWSRGISSVDALTALLPNASVNETGEIGAIRFPILRDIITKDERLDDAPAGLNHFRSAFQNAGIVLEIKEVGAESPVNGDPNAPLTKINWKTYRFKYATKIIPTLRLVDLEMNGVRIKKIIYSPKDGGMWMVEGEFYSSN